MRLFMLALLTMILFSANNLLCRMALALTSMDAWSFTIVRIVSGAMTLWLLLGLRYGIKLKSGGSFKAAAALSVYMLTFSFAYSGLPAATGTLIFVVAILLTAIAASRFLGEPISKGQLIGVAITFSGLVLLLAPAVSRPSPLAALFMVSAGAAWAIYSIMGGKSVDPALDTAGNFTRCLPFALLLLPFVKEMPLEGVLCAFGSGALASGMGYILWYRLVTLLSALTAVLVQLTMPVLTVIGAWLFLSEDLTVRLFVCSGIILFGIAFAHLNPGGRHHRPSAGRRASRPR